jgi:Site-specific recombinase XerD
VQTGLRVSELTGLRREDLHLEAGAHVRCSGKGRKERCTPLTKQAVMAIKSWLQEPGNDREWLFTSAHGCRLSADAVQGLLAKYHQTASRRCPSLAKKRVTPHVLRHTLAMQLLQSGIDRSVIALWLGHESVETTQIYLDANLGIERTGSGQNSPKRRCVAPLQSRGLTVGISQTPVNPKVLCRVKTSKPVCLDSPPGIVCHAA